MITADLIRERARIARLQGYGGIVFGFKDAEEIAKKMEIADRNEVIIPLPSRKKIKLETQE